VGENIRGVGFLAIKYYATVSKSMVMFFLTGLFGVDKHKLFAFFVKKKNKKICHIKKCLYICTDFMRVESE